MSITTGQSLNNADSPSNQGGGPTVQWHYAGTDRTYGVQIIWQSPGLETTMEYDIKMACSGVRNDDGVWQITKNNFYTDNMRPEDSLELLAMACTQPCYPFEFTAAKNGPITSIVNAEKIRNRFTDAKPVLLRDFDGEIAVAYITEMENAVKEPQRLKNIVTSDLWLSMFFSAITGNYDTNKTKPVTLQLPCFGFQDPLNFKGTISIGNPDFINKAQALLIDAELDISMSTKNKTFLDGKIQANYDIDIPGHQIRNIGAHILVNTTDGEHHVWLKGYHIATELIKPEQETKNESVRSKSWFSIFTD